MNMDQFYKPNGEVQGDTTPMPNKGTGSGVTDTYGADIGATAENRIGSIAGAAKSDKPEPA